MIDELIWWPSLKTWISIRDDLDPSKVCFWYTVFPHVNDTQLLKMHNTFQIKILPEDCRLPVNSDAAICTCKLGNWSKEKSESWAQRTQDHMLGIKNKCCSFAVPQPGECSFLYVSISSSKMTDSCFLSLQICNMPMFFKASLEVEETIRKHRGAKVRIFPTA